jgi:hypothetical protein
MAPEQIEGHSRAASDQYALGVVVYEWLCGACPFEGSLIEVLVQHLTMPPPPWHEKGATIPAELEHVVLRALAKDPEARFASVQDFADVLQEVGEATQRLSLPISSERRSREQVPPPEILPALRHEPSPQEQARSSSTTQPLVLIHTHTADGETPVALEVLPSAAQKHTSSQHPGVALARTNRQRFLRKVRAFWITGVFEHSLHGAALIALGLQEQPEAVANPWQLVLQHPAGEPRSLPAGTRITEVYDAAEGELLILGAPGSGKSTLLLELARELLERAEYDERHPLPTLFNLSSWASKRQPLADWLVEELSSSYQVPRKLGQAWVEADQILPLLDGLDEVAPQDRTACIESINTYRGEHGLLPLVVCSRSADYLAQATRIQLGSAVAVQPLTEQQVNDYLARGGEPLWALRVALQQDATLRELTSTPLMLSILTLTYHGMALDGLLREGIAPTRQQIFERYVERMLKQRGTAMRYTAEQTRHWLTFLARQLKQHNRTVFYLEHLQPDWLSGDRMHRVYDRWALRFPAILMGILVTLAINLVLTPASFFSLSDDALFLAPIMVLGGFLGWLLESGSTSQPSHENSRKARSGSWTRLVARLRTGILFGLSYGLSVTLSVGLQYGLSGGLLSLLLIGKPVGITLTDELVWSRRSLGRSLFAKRHLATLRVMVIIGLIVGLSAVLSTDVNFGLHYRLSAGLIKWLSDGLRLGLSTGLTFGLSFWLLFGLFQGVSSETIGDQYRVVPNQGIRRSARNSLILGLISTAIAGLSATLSTMLSNGMIFGLSAVLSERLSEGLSAALSAASNVLSTGLSAGIIRGLSVGILAGLLYGGLACLRHSVVRLLLWRAGSIPWNYPGFLDAASEHILLHKVGGGYIFVHRLLLEYFASLYEASTLEEARSQE